MPIINQQKREINYKIVYYGTGLGGKTTNIKFIHSTVPNDQRSELVSMATATERTLFFDYLMLDVAKAPNDFRVKFSLYTVPGQEEYRQSRRVILKGADGIVFVADSSNVKAAENRASMQELREYLKMQNQNLEDIPLILQYNKRDLDEIMPFDEMDRQLNPNNVPAFEAIAISGMQVLGTLKAISRLVIDPQMRM